jgi:hypothetical protein
LPSVFFFYRHLNGILGQYLLNQLGPLYQAQATTVEVVLVAHVVNFFKLLNAVEIKVIDTLALARRVLVDDGKGGRCNHILYTQSLANGLDKCGFSGTHLTIKGKHTTIAHLGNKLSGGFPDLL